MLLHNYSKFFKNQRQLQIEKKAPKMKEESKSTTRRELVRKKLMCLSLSPFSQNSVFCFFFFGLIGKLLKLVAAAPDHLKINRTSV